MSNATHTSTTYIRDEYTYEWDGQVPVCPRVYDTPEEAAAYIEHSVTHYGADRSRYGRIMHSTRIVTNTEWTPTP